MAQWIPQADDEEGYPERIFLDAVKPEWICALYVHSDVLQLTTSNPLLHLNICYQIHT